jgi:hypothetical protein
MLMLGVVTGVVVVFSIIPGLEVDEPISLSRPWRGQDQGLRPSLS